VGCWRHSLEGQRKSKAHEALRCVRKGDLASHLQTRIADTMNEPNQITGANAGGPYLLAIRTHWTARVARFGR